MFAALRNRDFAFFWVAAAISNAGNWMQAITVPFIVYDLTKSNSWLGLAAFASFLPSVLGTACISAIVDRYERRHLLLLLQVIQMGTSAALWIVWVAGRATPWNMVALSAVSGFMGGMVGPAWNSFVPVIVPRELMASAIRLNAMQFAFGRALGPLLASAVLGPFGPGATLFLNVASYVFVIGVLVVLRPNAARPTGGGGLWRQVLDGWVYVFRQRRFAVVPICMFVSGFFGSSIIQLASALADEQFHRDRSSIGVLVGAFGAGSVVGSFLATAMGDRVRRSAQLYASFTCWILGLVVLGAAPWYPLSLVGLLIMGMAHVGTATTVSTAAQIQVSEEYRGRVAVAQMQGILLGIGLGALALAQTADLTSLRTMEVASAGVLVVLLAVGTRVFHGFRLLDPNATIR